MKNILGLVGALLACGCAGVVGQGAGAGEPSEPARTMVSVRSYHEAPMDVYAICGEHDGVRLGTVAAEGEAEFTPARSDMVCATGLRFAMVPEGQKEGGYLTDPVAVIPHAIALFIEKYPALSYWRAR